jgi:DNA repair protein RadC
MDNVQSDSYLHIHKLPEEERPRERLLRHGPESLSTVELVAILLGSGTKASPVLKLAQEIVTHFGSLQQLAEATLEELRHIKGIGLAKAIQLKACMNLGLRLSKQTFAPKYPISHPLHAYNLIKDDLQNEKRELFLVILQDIKNCLICHEIVGIGTLTNSLVHPREVFYPAIRHKAASLILVHNHPSGDPTPSHQDYQVTENLIQVGRLMGIPVNDHLIIGHEGYVSLRQKGIEF